MSQTSLVNKQVGPYGFGLMGFTWRAEPCPTEQAFDTMRHALSKSANFWNGGEFYGPPERNSLVLLNEYFTKYPEDADKVVLSIKGGAKKGTTIPDCSEEGVRRSIEDALKQLDGKKKIDIFECARIDPKVPVEDTIGYLAKYVKEGKIGAIGISEVSAKTIRRAAAVHPIAAVEVEMSLWAIDILQNGVAAACAECGIPIVAYSPLGRGALTGTPVRSNAEIPDNDHRKHMPKFQDDVLSVNNRILDEVQKIADRKGVSKPQIALAWVRAYSGRTIEDQTQGGKKVKLGEIIPIPGATTVARVEENIRPDITLTEEEMEELEELIKKFPTQGKRYVIQFILQVHLELTLIPTDTLQDTMLSPRARTSVLHSPNSYGSQ